MEGKKRRTPEQLERHRLWARANAHKRKRKPETEMQKERKRERMRALREADPEGVNLRKRMWYANNPEKAAKMRANRLARYPGLDFERAKAWRAAHLGRRLEDASYVRELLGISKEMKGRVPPELIEAKRLQLKLKRKLKELAK